MEKNLKAIIFDFDETLYYSPTALKKYIQYIKQTILALSNHTESEANEIIKKYGFDQRGENRVSFGKTCENFGVKKERWNKYKIKHFFEINYDDAKILDNNLLRALSKKYKLFIVSGELFQNILYKSKKLGIDVSCFCDIYAQKKTDKTPKSKIEIYQSILNDYKYHSENVLVFGDRYQVDIKPIELLGGHGFQIKDIDDLKNHLEKLL